MKRDFLFKDKADVIYSYNYVVGIRSRSGDVIINFYGSEASTEQQLKKELDEIDRVKNLFIKHFDLLKKEFQKDFEYYQKEAKNEF